MAAVAPPAARPWAFGCGYLHAAHAPRRRSRATIARRTRRASSAASGLLGHDSRRQSRTSADRPTEWPWGRSKFQRHARCRGRRSRWRPPAATGPARPCKRGQLLGRRAPSPARAPPLPWPSRTDTVGVSSVDELGQALSDLPGQPRPCSASGRQARDRRVSITSTSGNRSSAAQRPCRGGPSRSEGGPRRRLPPTSSLLAEEHHGLTSESGPAPSSVVAASPCPVAGQTTPGRWRPWRNSCPTPGRSGRREASTESQAGTSGDGGGVPPRRAEPAPHGR